MSVCTCLCLLGATASTTEDGKEYYYNVETRESQFELPQGALETAKAKAKRISDQVSNATPLLRALKHRTRKSESESVCVCCVCARDIRRMRPRFDLVDAR